jgi:hypothetical protein
MALNRRAIAARRGATMGTRTQLAIPSTMRTQILVLPGQTRRINPQFFRRDVD